MIVLSLREMLGYSGEANPKTGVLLRFKLSFLAVGVFFENTSHALTSFRSPLFEFLCSKSMIYF